MSKSKTEQMVELFEAIPVLEGCCVCIVVYCPEEGIQQSTGNFPRSGQINLLLHEAKHLERVVARDQKGPENDVH